MNTAGKVAQAVTHLVENEGILSDAFLDDVERGAIENYGWGLFTPGYYLQRSSRELAMVAEIRRHRAGEKESPTSTVPTHTVGKVTPYEYKPRWTKVYRGTVGFIQGIFLGLILGILLTLV